MKKTYYLKLLYPTSTNVYGEMAQSKNIEIEAYNFEIKNAGSYVFYNSNGDIIAMYPVNYTIIEKIS